MADILVGRKFSRWLVVSRDDTKDKDLKKRARWWCRCECGKRRSVREDALLSGRSKGCWCWRKKHGMEGTRFYHIWQGIKRRCDNEKNPNYSLYGGRGIKHSWHSFESFRDDMYDDYVKHVDRFGEKETTIDRIEPDGNYQRDNCRWATPLQQGRNTRTNFLITHQGKTKPLSEWSALTKINSDTIRERILRGWSAHDALTIRPKLGQKIYVKRSI